MFLFTFSFNIYQIFTILEHLLGLEFCLPFWHSLESSTFFSSNIMNNNVFFIFSCFKSEPNNEANDQHENYDCCDYPQSTTPYILLRLLHIKWNHTITIFIILLRLTCGFRRIDTCIFCFFIIICNICFVVQHSSVNNCKLIVIRRLWKRVLFRETNYFQVWFL